MNKAQSGAPAASLIIVIGAFILLFILFLPSEEREKLLEGEDSDFVSDEDEPIGSILLDERPGTITKLREREFEHNIPSFNLFTEKEDVILKTIDSVFIESSGIESRVVPLFVKGEVENTKLTFSVNDHSGRLTVMFNDGELFRGEIGNLVEPLSLDNPREENIIQFSVESVPAWQFWKNNFYDIRNVQIAATVEKLENREAVNTFFMTDEEVDPENVDDAYIIYLVDCRITDVGRLDVFLNNNLLSSKVPDCGSLEKTFIDPEDFV